MHNPLGRLLAFVGITVLVLVSRAELAQGVAPKDRILFLVSIDALRCDYLGKYPATNLNRMAAEGVQAKKLIPVFPTMTFPNHHSIVTGWWPARHGVIHNNIYDPVMKETFAFNKPELQGSQWWGGEPIWVTAIKQERRANVLFWPGTGATMAGHLPTEWKRYERDPSPNQIVDMGLAWLEQPIEKRPHFVMLYFHHVDSVGHKSGPDAPEMIDSVAQVDTAMGRLMDGIRRLKLEAVASVVVVSDHGMANISPQRTVALGDLVDLKTVQVDFSGALAGIRPLNGDTNALYRTLKEKENHFKVYNQENMPARYTFTNSPRIPPVIMVADEGWYLSRRASGEPPTREMNKGTHGFDPDLDSMGATFVAWGPAFRRGAKIEAFENIHIYNLLCAAMGLKPAPNDGDNRLLKQVLTP